VARVALSFPERVGSYELFAPIGAGGMATVYLGAVERDGGFQRQVAIKMIHGTEASEPQLAADLLREAKLAARIRHPNVVPVLDVGDDPRGLYLVMDYIEGDNLAGLRRAAQRLGEAVPVDVALRVATDALAGLHAAHELVDNAGRLIGVVHRDFSPHNILVGTDGVTRLTDFGIAKIAMTAGHTRTGKIKGKIAYMSPEQARGNKVDRRCDVWAAGVVVWELLTGERLHSAEDEIALLLKIVTDDPRRLRDIRPDLPVALDDALASALARDVEQRCSTADELRKKLVKSHPIADSATVAQWVSRIAEPKLRARAEKIAEIRLLRDSGVATGEVSVPSDHPFDQNREETLTHKRDDDASGEIPTRTSAVSGISHGVQRPGSPKQLAAVIGVVAGLALGLVVLVVFLAGSRDREPAAPGVATSSTLVQHDPSIPEAVSPSPPASTANPPAATFVVRANGDIRALTVAGKPVALASPVEEVQLPELPKAGDSIEATSVDGRKAKASVGSGSSDLVLEFPPPRAARPATGVAPTKPATKSTATDPPFATNPYLQKK
jgi:serine/threonine-protein kinase